MSTPLNSAFPATRLDGRAILRVRGADALRFIHGLVTNDVDGLIQGHARHVALLSPQGKILADFFVAPIGDGALIELAHDAAAEILKKLLLYKLRKPVTIEDISTGLSVWVAPSIAEVPAAEVLAAYADPRHPGLGFRIIAQSPGSAPEAADAAAYHAVRIALGVPDGGKDYDFSDTYPHEADLDLFHGLSFKKGCYVGQEIVSRMQHKTQIRKRVVPVQSDGDLPADRPEILAGEVAIGRLGSVAGSRGLALLRLDRVAEFAGKGVALRAGANGPVVSIAPEAAHLLRTATHSPAS